MAEYAYLDESLDINQTGMYHLSVQAGLNGLSFSILNIPENKYVALKHYPLVHEDHQGYLEGLRRVAEQDEFLRRSYRSVAVMPVSRRSTVIPAPLYREEEKENFLRFNLSPAGADERIRTWPLRGLDARVVFAVEKELDDLLETLFPEARMIHQTVPFLEGIVRYLGSKGKEPAVHVNVHDDLFDLAVFRGSVLQMVNTFRYRQVNDIVYFILYTFRTLEPDPSATPVVLQGKVNHNSSLVETLRRYIKKVSFARRDPSFTYSYTFNTVAEQTFVNLFNLYPCV